jgi:uncharacterized repeat protein (TIGR03803 family)
VASPAIAGTTLIVELGAAQGLLPIGASRTISATANATWKFGSWDDGNTDNPRTITVPAVNKTYTASFISQDPVAVTVVADPAAGGTASGSGNFVPGTTQTLAIAVNSGWTFSGWNDGVTTNPRTAVVSASASANNYTGTLVQVSSLNVQAAATMSALRSFSGGSDGASPRAGLVQGTDGYFYGTTYTGGAYGKGTIFKVNSNGTWVTLRHLGVAANDGANPLATLLNGNDGYFYGTTWAGGSASLNNGTIFRINPSGSGFNTMYSFNGGTDGANPAAGLVKDGAGNLFGTTQNGGSGNNGTVFYLIPSWVEIPLYKFGGTTDGGAPMAGLLIGSDGSYYGTASAGGASSAGVAFKMSLVGGRYITSTLHTFTGTDGRLPYANLIQGRDGYFYGTSWNGGSGGGNIFQMDAAGNVNNLHSLTSAEGVNPRARLVQASNGSFYGTAQNGGAHGKGAIFRLTTNGVFTTVYSFTGGTDGSYPWGELVQGSDGYFYGTTSAGGASGNGTVFRVLLPDPATVTVQVNPSAGGSAWVSQSGANLQLQAATNTGWIFTGWNDGNTDNPRTVAVPPTNITYTANFATNVLVTVTASPVAGGTAGTTGNYWSGSNITLTAVANGGWLFTQWSDGNLAAPRVITVPVGGTNFTALFTNAATLTVLSSSAPHGSVSGGGTYVSNSFVTISAVANMGGRFAGWSDGDPNSTRAYLATTNISLTALFTNAPMYVLLQQGNGGMAGQWRLGTNSYLPTAWLTMTGALGGGWVLRAIDQHRALLQKGTGGMVGLWELNSSGVPTNWWTVAASVAGWIARDLDGNRILLQNGDGGMVGIWTLNALNVPVLWKTVSPAVPGLIARALSADRILFQRTSGTPPAGYWVLDGAYNILSTTPLTATVPPGWVLRSVTPTYMLLQYGDGGMIGMWDLDAGGQPTAWHTINGALPGWIARGMDQP